MTGSGGRRGPGGRRAHHRHPVPQASRWRRPGAAHRHRIAAAPGGRLSRERGSRFVRLRGGVVQLHNRRKRQSVPRATAQASATSYLELRVVGVALGPRAAVIPPPGERQPRVAADADGVVHDRRHDRPAALQDTGGQNHICGFALVAIAGLPIRPIMGNARPLPRWPTRQDLPPGTGHSARAPIAFERSALAGHSAAHSRTSGVQVILRPPPALGLCRTPRNGGIDSTQPRQRAFRSRRKICRGPRARST